MEPAPHGTEARARKHWRDGDSPLRAICELCADASMIAHRYRNTARYQRTERQAA